VLSCLGVETHTAPQQSATLPATAEWLAAGTPFTPDEIHALFESNSPVLRDNPYALGVPVNTLRALRSDWRVFLRFCDLYGFLALPSSPAVVAFRRLDRSQDASLLHARVGGARIGHGPHDESQKTDCKLKTAT
jgi:hypothetical protein